MTVSVVIPCWNDRERAEQRVRELAGCEGLVEIVIADATPGDGEWAVEGARVLRCAVAGRGPQMNAGAAVCRGDVLLFSHADTRLTAAHVAVVRALPEGFEAGGFYKAFEIHHPRLAWLDPVVRWYTGRFGILYGDHSVFVRREVFEAMGGFKPVRLMEDVEFSGRLRARGAVALFDPPVETSMRRFRRRGYLRNRLQNLMFVWLWRAGLVDEERLYRFYYGAGTGR